MTKAKPKKEKSPMRPTLIGIPAMDMMQTVTCRSLVGLAVPPGTNYSFAIGSLVDDARNKIVDDALKTGAERILFIDSDMAFNPDLLTRLQVTMSVTGADVVCGIMTTRKPPLQPVIYKSLDWEVTEDGYVKVNKVTYDDYPENSVFEVAACGFGATLVTVDICKKVMGIYGAPFTRLPGLGEDLSFCVNVHKAGGKVFCDSRVKVGHIGLTIYEEQSWFDYKRMLAAAEAKKDDG